MSATPNRFAENLSRADDVKLLKGRLAACQWFLAQGEQRFAHLSSNGASDASLQAERLSVARNIAAIKAISAKLEKVTV